MNFFKRLISRIKKPRQDNLYKNIESQFKCIINDNKIYLETLINSDKTIFEESADLQQGKSETEILKNFLLGQDPVEQALPKSALKIKNNRCDAEWVTEAIEAIGKLFLLYRGAIVAFNVALEKEAARYNRLEDDYSKLFLPISNCKDEEDKLELLRDEIRRYMLAVRELRVVENIYNKMTECTNYDQLRIQVFNLKKLLQEFNEKVSKE